MGWDEAIFGWLFRRARGLIDKRPSDEARAKSATLEELGPSLAIVASAVAEQKVELRAADGHGGFAAGVIWVPAVISEAESKSLNERIIVVRVLTSAVAMREGIALPRAMSERESLAWTAVAMCYARRKIDDELPAASELVRDEYERALANRSNSDADPLEALVRRALRDELDARSWLAAAERECALVRGEGAAQTPLAWPLLRPASAATDAATMRRTPMPTRSLASGTERKGRDRETVQRITMKEERLDENPLVHSFEKVHTAEEYKGGRKSVDGSDEMAAHQEALDELDLREVIRSSQTTSSVYRADVWLDNASADLASPDLSSDEAFTYDEWNHSERQWRRDWCSVRMGVQRENVASDRAKAEAQRALRRYREEVRSLRAEFERREQARAWRARQRDGAEVDTDAVVDRFASIIAGHTPDDRLYVARRRAAHEVATVILLDASLSTDGWVAGRRVLDVERESVLVLGEALRGLHDELAVLTFSSHTRRDCRVAVLKGSREPWERAWTRLGSVQPAGYTRIGPALRHATAMLRKTHARKKLLVLVSDGRPTDYDRYEGRYGVEDVAMAVREAEREHVFVHALAVDKQARGHFTEMFGKGRFAILSRPDELTRAMGAVIAKLGE
ncbi:MAG: VWA domain-containing protein [Polyangiales bacterium]